MAPQRNESPRWRIIPALLSWSVPTNQLRALRYRKLALQEPDKEKAQRLQLLADEADRGVLCSVEWTLHGSKIAIPIKSNEAKARTPYICENDLGWLTSAISARCLIMRGPCPVRRAIRCSSVAGSSAHHRQGSLGLLCIDMQHIKRIGEFVRHLHAPFPSRLELAI
jgi:hypothetical protein